MALPLPIHLKDHFDDLHCHDDKTICSRLPPPPCPRPSDKHIASHSDVLYDSESNWLSSNLLLSLGTICISYKNDVSSDVLKFGLKVAIRDKHGNPLVWRDLPFLEPDIMPSISTIVSILSGTFVSNLTLSTEISGINNEISVVQSEVSVVLTEISNVQTSVEYANTLISVVQEQLPVLSVEIKEEVMDDIQETFWMIDCGSGTEIITPDETINILGRSRDISSR